MIPLRASEFPQGHLRKVSSSSPGEVVVGHTGIFTGFLMRETPGIMSAMAGGWCFEYPPPIPGSMVSPARPLPPGSGCSSCRRDVSPPPHAQEGGSSDLQRQWFCQSTRAGGETPGRLDLPRLGCPGPDLTSFSVPAPWMMVPDGVDSPGSGRSAQGPGYLRGRLDPDPPGFAE